MMKSSIRAVASHGAVPASILAVCLLTTSCKIPSRATWAMVQQRGLIPVMMDANPEPAAPILPDSALAQKTVIPGEAAPIKVQAVQQPEIAKVPFATPVPGRPGFVFSPHSAGKKLIDVRNYAAGAEVRCPYTMQAFNVPDFAVLAGAPPIIKPRPQRSVAELASSNPGSNAEQVPLLTPNAEPAPAFPSSETDIPYGSRVTGRPGFVYSPFAEKNQLVDVAGIAPGVEVKCPYSAKLFRVPEPLPEELVPPPANVIPPAPPAPETPPSPAPSPSASASNPAPAPAAAPPTSQAPTASWADKEKNLVQSPHGSPGQLVDVSGRPPGSTMQCPFTNKEFIIPAP